MDRFLLHMMVNSTGAVTGIKLTKLYKYFIDALSYMLSLDSMMKCIGNSPNCILFATYCIHVLLLENRVSFYKVYS